MQRHRLDRGAPLRTRDGCPADPANPPSRVARSLLIAAALLSVVAVQAASPNLGSITPHGAQRGREVEVFFNGARLSDAQEILLYDPGIACAQLEVVNDNQVKTRLSIAADCPLGVHAMRVRTATGISELRLFWVGALPDVAEAEPNNDFAQPQPIPLDVTVGGLVDNEDVDYFVVDARQGERITAEIEGLRLGYTFFDPYVAILDAARFELAASDDAPLLNQDCVASIVAPKDGKYIIQVRDSAYGGNSSCVYRLHVGRFPRPTGVYPPGGRFGETVSVEWLGGAAPVAGQSFTLPADPRPGFALFPQDATGIAPSGLPFRLSDLPNVLEIEPNDGGFAQATPLTVPAAANGVIAAEGDVDYFQFTAAKGQVFDIAVHARSLRSPLDPVLVVQRKDGTGVASSDDAGTPDAFQRFTAPEDDTYTLAVYDHLRQGGADYAYRVEIAPVKPLLTLGLPERAQFVDITNSVPRGGRTACLVSAARQDWGGDLTLSFEGLPVGVTAETVPMAANMTLVPVVFTAAADAPPAGALVDVIGRPVDANLPVVGRLQQVTSLVRGDNNIHMWDHRTERMALAVTDEAPFEIEIVEPKAPLVRDGVMNLKVVAHRKEGYTAPIYVRMLYDPPGTGSSYSISIPEGGSEALIPLNANGSAELKTWPIVVLGEGPKDGGTITVASPMTNLTVAAPYVGFQFQAAAVEQGRETELVVGVSTLVDFDGAASVELLGLPNEVSTEIGQITKDSTELVYKIKTTSNSPAGKHGTLLARAIVTVEGEPVTHMIGTGELRIDTPLPAPAAEPAAAEPAPAPEAAPAQRLTRLQQLRADREKAKQAKAAASASPDPAPTP